MQAIVKDEITFDYIVRQTKNLAFIVFHHDE